MQVSVNPDAVPDKRSYRVSFARFEGLAPDHQPQVDLEAAVTDLVGGLNRMSFSDAGFRESQLARLPVLTRLRAMRLIDDDLRWIVGSEDRTRERDRSLPIAAG